MYAALPDRPELNRTILGVLPLLQDVRSLEPKCVFPRFKSYKEIQSLDFMHFSFSAIIDSQIEYQLDLV